MSDNINSEEILYELSPKFDFIYELFMPTGRKIKNTIFIWFIVLLASIFFFSGLVSKEVNNIVVFGNINIMTILNYICIIALVLITLKLIFHIVVQSMQYKHITYRFYKAHMVYEDDFLNQHRKNIEYSNIKEVEIRRTIIDRILGFGVIVIYTNAENRRSNGLVIYGIKEPKKSYDIIYNIIHKEQTDASICDNKMDSSKDEVIEEKIELSDKKETEISDNEDYSSEEQRKKRIEENKKEKEEFLNSLKDINSDDN